jgi:hypothetical protein
LFFRKDAKPGSPLPVGDARPGFGVKDWEWLVTPNCLVPQGAAKRPRKPALSLSKGTFQEATSWNFLRDAMLRIAP